MYDIGSIPRESFLTTLQNELTLTSTQASALQAEFRNDPASRGYAGKNDKKCLELFVTEYSVKNNSSQEMVPIPVERYDRLQQYIADQFADGKVKQSVFEKYCYELDPTWLPELWFAPRSEVVLGPGLIPTLQEVKAARA